MRELTISKIQELSNGEIIPSFRGTITKVYEQKRGLGEYGEWHLQNMIVEDHTGKVQVTWGGEDDVSSIEGETRLFESSETKHGLQGCRWEIKKVNGMVYKSVKLTGSCKIKPLSGSAWAGDEAASRGTSGGVARATDVAGQPKGTALEASPAQKPYDRQARIERQHSQEMAIRAIVATGPADEMAMTTFRNLISDWTDWFQADLDNEPRIENAEPNPTAEDHEVPF